MKKQFGGVQDKSNRTYEEKLGQEARIEQFERNRKRRKCVMLLTASLMTEKNNEGPSHTGWSFSDAKKQRGESRSSRRNPDMLVLRFDDKGGPFCIA